MPQQNDQRLISPHNITTSSNIQITRVKEMINKDESCLFFPWKRTLVLAEYVTPKIWS